MLASSGESSVSQIDRGVGAMLLGGAFVIFGVRNWLHNVPRLSGILATKNFPTTAGHRALRNRAGTSWAGC